MTVTHRLLIVEGDDVLRDLLVEQLAPCSDLDVTACREGGSGRVQLGEGAYDAVVADAALPDMKGRVFVAAIREDGFRGPVLMLSAPDALEDDGLEESGALESIAKPFRFAVLLARLRAQLRAHEASEEAAVAIGPYTFRAGAKTLTSEVGGLLRLTEKEAAILRYLHRAGEEVIGRDILLQEVWGYHSAVTTHTLETHIYRLRQKIEIDPSDARILVTEPGGYRLMA